MSKVVAMRLLGGSAITAIRTGRASAALFLLFWSCMAPTVLGQGLVIDHKELSCVVAEKFPRLTACIAPRSHVAQARVYFHAEGASSWYYVQLTSDMPCYRGVLPKPQRTLQRFRYYIAATDTAFTETQTGEYTAEVVPDESRCRKGPLAPFLNNAAVAVNSLAGTAAIPEGFVTAGLAGAGLSSGLLLGVVGGGTAVVGGIAGIGGGKGAGSGAPPSSGPPATALPGTSLPPGTPTTTLPPGVPTTTVLAAPTTTVPGTPTTTLPGSPTTPSSCTGDATPPSVSITSPIEGPIPGLSAALRASASAANGVANVQFFYQETGASTFVLIGTATSPPYSVLWVFPTCTAVLNSTFKLTAVATDTCGNVAASPLVGVNLNGRGCFLGAAHPAPALAWTNDLSAPGARGQVVLNGTEAFFPGPGPSRVAAHGQRGYNRVEAMLVEGRGQRGTWRFDFEGAGVIAGSLRVVAGEVELATPDSIAFRLAGRPGERVVFSFRLGEP